MPMELRCIDFSRAFDSVNHRLNLRAFGICGRLLKFVDEFLISRTFYVRVGDASSGIRVGTSGMLQGSVVGPLLSKDGPATALQSPSSFFADDVKVIGSSGRHALGRNIVQVLNRTKARSAT